MQNFTKFWEVTTVQRNALCRSRRELSNAYFLAKFGFDTAENEPFQVCPLSAYRSPRWSPFFTKRGQQRNALMIPTSHDLNFHPSLCSYFTKLISTGHLSLLICRLVFCDCWWIASVSKIIKNKIIPSKVNEYHTSKSGPINTWARWGLLVIFWNFLNQNFQESSFFCRYFQGPFFL